MTNPNDLIRRGDARKKLAIEISGARTRFPYSPHEPSRESRFDAMWPSLQQEYLERADRILRAATSDQSEEPN